MIILQHMPERYKTMCDLIREQSGKPDYCLLQEVMEYETGLPEEPIVAVLGSRQRHAQNLKALLNTPDIQCPQCPRENLQKAWKMLAEYKKRHSLDG